MKILIVGCGAVGQVLGLCLQEADVEIGFYARSESADQLKQLVEQGGIPLFQISHLHRWAPIPHRLEKYQVLTDVAGSQSFKPDQIWFATPSPVYYSEWFRGFLREVPSKRVMCFAPEGGRPEFASEIGDEERLVFGGITFMAWQGDLNGGGGQPGCVNFWLPTLLEIPLMGGAKACYEVAEVLVKGGFRASVKKDEFQKTQASVTALMSAFTAGLELSGWSFRTFRRSPWLTRAARASQEATRSQLSGAGTFTKTLFRLLSSPVTFIIATFVLPPFFPFRLEKYLKFHYLKTRDQTLNLLDLFAMDGERRGLPVRNIRILLQGLQDAA